MTVDMTIGIVGMLVWGALCGMPALALYNLALRTRTGWPLWLLFAGILLVWLPLVTALCVWAVLHLIGGP